MDELKNQWMRSMSNNCFLYAVENTEKYKTYSLPLWMLYNQVETQS